MHSVLYPEKRKGQKNDMKFHKDMLLLYAVTDRKWTGRQSLEEQIQKMR